MVAGGEPLRGRDVIVETFVRARSAFRLCVQEIMSGYVDPPAGDETSAAPTGRSGSCSGGPTAAAAS